MQLDLPFGFGFIFPRQQLAGCGYEMESHHAINPIMAHHVFQAHNYTTTRPVEVAGCLPFDIGEGDELTSRSACSLSSYQSAIQ